MPLCIRPTLFINIFPLGPQNDPPLVSNCQWLCISRQANDVGTKGQTTTSSALLLLLNLFAPCLPFNGSGFKVWKFKGTASVPRPGCVCSNWRSPLALPSAPQHDRDRPNTAAALLGTFSSPWNSAVSFTFFNTMVSMCWFIINWDRSSSLLSLFLNLQASHYVDVFMYLMKYPRWQGALSRFALCTCWPAAQTPLELPPNSCPENRPSKSHKFTQAS